MTKGTIAAQIREKIDLMAALVQSVKPDGGSYAYGEVLTIAGLPATHAFVRELSNQLIARGVRRHKEKTRTAQPSGELIPEEPQPEAETDDKLDALRDVHRQMYARLDEISDAWEILQKALAGLADLWRQMGVPLGLVKPTAQEGGAE